MDTLHWKEAFFGWLSDEDQQEHDMLHQNLEDIQTKRPEILEKREELIEKKEFLEQQRDELYPSDSGTSGGGLDNLLSSGLN